jgi:uncharacterized membrane protein HdeD (DUF308 family)
MLGRERAKYWWIVLLIGIAWLVIAWLVLRADVTSLATVGFLLGGLFIASGVNELAVGSMVGGGWKVLHYIIAVILLLGGVWAFIRPINTFFALASVLGLVLILQGAFEIVRGVSSRDENPYWWLGLVSGVLLVLLAFWVSASDRVFQPGPYVPDPVLGRPVGTVPGDHVDRLRVRDPARRPIRGGSLTLRRRSQAGQRRRCGVGA